MSTPDFEKLDQLAALVGLSREEFIQLAMKAGGAMDGVREEAEKLESPPPIVYPNVRFAPYKYREYPKALYRGYIRDIEETVTKLIPREGGGVDQQVFIRVIPDQFVQELREVGSKAEELTALASGWYLTRGEAIERAQIAKLNTRSIVERPAPARRGRPPKVHVSQVVDEEADAADDSNPMAEGAAA